MHLAYSDIKSIQKIKPLSSFNELSILTQLEIPLAALNYIAFVKIIIPSLLVLDVRDANHSIIAANVYPNQQIFILRDALNKLLDERNNHSQNQMNNLSYSDKIKEKRQSLQMDSPHRQSQHDDQNENSHIMNLFKDWIFSLQKKIYIKRVEITDLSEIYSQFIGSSKKTPENPQKQYDIIEKLNKYKQKEDKGKLSIEKKYKLKKMIKQVQVQEQMQIKNKNQSRNALQNLQLKQFYYSKLQQRQNVHKKLRETYKNLMQTLPRSY